VTLDIPPRIRRPQPAPNAYIDIPGNLRWPSRSDLSASRDLGPLHGIRIGYETSLDLRPCRDDGFGTPVKAYAADAGQPKIAPHDLRRQIPGRRQGRGPTRAVDARTSRQGGYEISQLKHTSSKNASAG
jgi:hypothetical protein